ncbi:3'(2'),5'-bisphosphate nucleotidase CysQ [Actibacterium pelagium]|uniref:3'(2'),5'-bisphosphate nucleotidase CysQ n=1 Tax=Actibacterium pelagium TaxID=2029103 RepID=A0A917AJ91_9RHOB|nr:3'(2'),5'-bisphosphate nucleotidase CysQ [Actibacterium pelagium]GGE56239.1 3'(2'),5'-bisphosphate nucleotidase CysQ [Actibacterium pelagium]
MPESDLPLLIEAAKEAGRIATHFWGNSPEVWEKSDGQGPVSEADIAVDRALREILTDARPNYGWLSEETEDDLARLQADTVFVVDPIDGTRAFLNGEPTFATSIGLVQNGRAIAGVVYLPALDKLYTGAIGAGAALNGAAIQTSDRVALDGADILAAKPTFQAHHWRDMPNVQRHFRTSLAYRLCLVAEGRFDAMLTLRDTWHWDIAAGAVIVAEAGGAATDKTGADLTFNSPVAQSQGIVATAGALHAETIKRLA